MDDMVRQNLLQVKKMFGITKDRVMPIHNSLQIWYEGQEKAELQLDIKVWRLKSIWQRNIYLDFGIKILNPHKVKRVFVYFPFGVNKANIMDLGKELENTSLLNGIFNENYTIQTHTKNIIVKDDMGNAFFSIYELDIEKDITLERSFSGTVMSFEVKESPNPKYYRFRIKAENYGTLFEKYKPKNSFFDSAFIETEMIDFRINEKRNQHAGLMEMIEENQKFIIKDINFFVMSPIQDEIESDGVNLVYKRQLEMGNFWRRYLECGYKRMSVYKCKTAIGRARIDDFNCFCKINYRKSNLWTIALYLVVLCFLSVSFNCLSNILWLFLSNIIK